MRVTSRIVGIVLFVAIAPYARAAVTGRVLDTQGQPRPGAQVVAFAREASDERAARRSAGRARIPVATAFTATDGGFRLTVTAAVVDVAVTASGYAPAAETLADGDERTFVLAAAPFVRARVHASGRPVAGAAAYWTIGHSPQGEHELLLRTDPDGGYDIPAPREWAGGVVVTHPAYSPRTDASGRSSALSQELLPGLTVEGRVTDRAGAPVRDAELFADGWALGRSGADGSFLLRRVPPRWSRFEARTSSAAGSASPGAGRVVVRMEPLRRLGGVVRSRRGGSPVAGARVTLESRMEASSTLTDASGRYVLQLPAGRYRIEVDRPGFAFDFADEQEIDLTRTRALVRDLQIDPTTRITAVVTDDQGRAIEAALVRLLSSKAPRFYTRTNIAQGEAASCWTSADGTCTLRLPTDDDRQNDWSAVALKPGFAMAVVESVHPDEPRRDVRLALSRGLELSGRVVDRDGTPLAGALVVVVESAGFTGFVQRGPSAALGPHAWIRTDAQGAFVTRVRAVEHELLVLADGRAPGTAHGRHPSQTDPLLVSLEQAAEIRGRVVRADGLGVGDAIVHAWRTTMGQPADSSTTEDGGFALGGLVPGSYELLVARGDRLLAHPRTVEAPAFDLRIELAPTGRIEGRVLHARTRAPLAQFVVSLDPDQPEEPATGAEFPTGAPGEEPGRFAIDDAPLGTHTLEVRAPGFLPWKLEGLVLAERPADPLEVALEPGATVRGRVTAEDGQPLTDVTVTAEGDERETAQSDAQGEYVLEGLPLGPARLVFSAEGFRSARREIEANGEVPLDVTLLRGLAVSGIVTRDGVPQARVHVYAQSAVAGADGARAMTDRRGRFTLSGLTPGRYTVSATGPEGGSAKAEDVDVERAGTLRLSLDQTRTGIVHGRVLGLPADGEHTVYVRAIGGDGQDGDRADAVGSFRLEKVPAGPVRVVAITMAADGAGRSSRTVRLDVEPGAEHEVQVEFTSDVVVSGTVTHDGAPAARAIVTFDAQGEQLARALTDASGYYSLVGLEPGRYKVAVSGHELSYEAEHAIAGSTQLDIDASGASLAGSVTDAATGDPIAAADVSLWRLDAGETRPSTTLSTSPSGAFTSRGLVPGAYRVLVQRAGYGQELREIELPRGSPGEGLMVELAPAAGLSLQVVDARDGRALEAYVVVRDSAGRVVANTHSGVKDDGTLTIPLAPGRYRLSTSASGYGTRTVAVSAPGSGVRVPLTPGGTLVVESQRELRGRLRLTQPDGEEYVRCYCNGIAGIDLAGRRTTTPNIQPGSYAAELFDLTGKPLAPARLVVVEEGRTATLVVE